MHSEHGVKLLQTDMQQIVRIVNEMQNEHPETCDHYFPRRSTGEFLPCEFCGHVKTKQK